MSEDEIVNQIHLYEYMLRSHELNCEGIVELKMHVCKSYEYIRSLIMTNVVWCTPTCGIT